jgi:hypothetical protein
MVKVDRRFLNWEEAFLYAATLARRVRADGAEALRSDLQPTPAAGAGEESGSPAS